MSTIRPATDEELVEIASEKGMRMSGDQIVYATVTANATLPRRRSVKGIINDIVVLECAAADFDGKYTGSADSPNPQCLTMYVGKGDNAKLKFAGHGTHKVYFQRLDP